MDFFVHVEEASKAPSGVSDMFDEAPAINLIAQMLVEVRTNELRLIEEPEDN